MKNDIIITISILGLDLKKLTKPNTHSKVYKA